MFLIERKAQFWWSKSNKNEIIYSFSHSMAIFEFSKIVPFGNHQRGRNWRIGWHNTAASIYSSRQFQQGIILWTRRNADMGSTTWQILKNNRVNRK
jgi:hypothetical protein